MPPVTAPAVTSPPATGQSPTQGVTAQATASGQNAPPPPPVPFTLAAREFITPAKSLAPVVLNASQQELGPIELPAQGWSAGWAITVTGTAAGNAAAVAFAADAPFNVVNAISFLDAAQDTIEVPVNGYLQYLKRKYGALSLDPPECDARVDPQYSLVSGAGASGGSFKFRIFVYPQLDPVNAYGALPNLASNKRMLLGTLQLNSLANIYATAPTNPPSVSVQIDNVWWKPGVPTNAVGVPQNQRPYGAGSLSKWTVETPVVAQGDQTIDLLNTGAVIRCMILVLRTAAGVRTDADWPSRMQLVLNNDVMFDFRPDQWKSNMAEAYGYKAAIDGPNGLDTGVYVYYPLLPREGSRVKASGPRNQMLPTMDTAKLQLIATGFGANASKLTVLTNNLIPGSSVPGMEVHAMYATGVV